jgi:hypothetical protein
MGWANGKFSRVENWQNDAAAGVKILASKHDNEDTNLANGIDSCLHKGGGNAATANLSMAGFRLTNLGNPTADQDAATRKWVISGAVGWTTARTIEGTDINGRLNFTGATGNNGLTFTNSNLSWLAKPAKEDQTSHRLVLNNGLANPTDSGSDVFVLDEAGRANFPVWSQNLSLSSNDSKWRTISPGYGSYMVQSGGSLSFYANQTATVTDNYVATNPAPVQVLNMARTGVMTVYGQKAARIHLQKGDNTTNSANYFAGYGHNGTARWLIAVGDTTVESGTAVGSNFAILRYNNSGANLGAALSINRETGAVTIPGELVTNGGFTSDSYFASSDVTCIVATTGAGTIYLRPNGKDSAVEQTTISSTNGDMAVTGSINAVASNMRMGTGGTGRIMQFASGYYWDWEDANGNLTWRRGGGGWGAILYQTGDFTIYNNVAAKLNAGQWVAYSDARLKSIGAAYSAGLNEVMQIVPKWFKRKDDPDQRDFVGLIGQEIERVLPETVKRMKGRIGKDEVDDLIQFDPTNIQYALVNAVKELKALLDAATARIAALEAK